MGKAHIILLLVSSLLFLIANTQNLFHETEKRENFIVYHQIVLGGPYETVYEVARANITSSSPTNFGAVYVFDDLMTAEPEENSEKLGRIQGLVASSDLEETALTMNFNLVFTAGKYKGSTLAIVGQNPTTRPNRELPIVTGTGCFRWVRGYIIANNYTEYNATGYGVSEYKIYVVYLEQEPGFGFYG